ncbi:MAG: tetratricopeptide repeat protein [Acidobacteria bacterium]|nr:tetratricopeptide repeat protein [Acidobacteriota bacterium]
MVRAALSSPAIPILLVVAAALAVSAPALHHGLVFDDHLLIDGNADLIRGDVPLSAALTRRYWGSAHEAAANELYRPATILSLAAGARHAVNSALHASNAALAFSLFRALDLAPPISLFAALVFAVHPIATEAVVPISGRSDLLATFFVLASTLLAVSGARASGWRRVAFVVGAALMALLGALSKESAFVVPVVTCAALLTRRTPRGGTILVAQCVALAAALALRVGVLGYFFQSSAPADPRDAYLAFVNNPVQFATVGVRVMTALRVILGAAGLLVFPFHLSADYSFDQIPVFSGSLTLVDVADLCLALAFAGAIVFFMRRAPVAAFALAWIAATYLPASNILFPTGTIFGERLLYMPLVGFALLVALANGRAPRIPGAILAVVLVTLLGARFIARTADWSSDDALFESAALASPRSTKAHSNHGYTLQAQGRIVEAAAEYRRALEIAPKLTGARISLARCLVQLDRPGEALALLEEERKLGDFPALTADLAGAHYAVAVDSLNRGDLDAARKHAEAARRSGYELPRDFLERLSPAAPPPAAPR